MSQDENSPLWAPRKKDKDRLLPLWYLGDIEYHPEQATDVHVIFYSVKVNNDMPEKLQLVDNELTLYTNNEKSSFQWVFAQIEAFIKERFISCIIFHIPRNYFVQLRRLNDYSAKASKSFNEEQPFYKDLDESDNCVHMVETHLLCDVAKTGRDDVVCFAIEPGSDTEKLIRLRARELFEEELIKKCGNSFEMISLGGWCGPVEAFRKLKIRKGALPFDYIHSSMEGINLMFDGQESEYYPSSGESRTRYALYPHHDLQDPVTKASMKRRFSRLRSLLLDARPATFVRAVINPDFSQELEQAKIFFAILKNKYQRTNDRLVLIFHDQRVGTVQIEPLADNIMCWSAQGQVGWHVPNRDEIACSYMKIISFALIEENWPPQYQYKNHKLLKQSSYEISKTLFDERPVEKPVLAINWNSARMRPLEPAVTTHQPAALLIAGCPHSGMSLLDS
ncbi:MAG: hypothetical protein KAJ95_08330, partial [Gammaproteobacteria bacterium]|nr:hypothetical protein [Gammaproteobacteria bacterium]